MPVTRKSSRSSTGAGSGKQQTLSFKHKVTKSIQSGGKKDAFKSPSRSKEYIPEPSPEASPASPSPTTPATIDGKAEEGTGKEVQIPGNRRLERIEDQAQPALVAEPKSEAELRAQQITDNAIERYWSGIESSRMARAVHRKHTEGLSTGEKVLRYFDVSSQYGVRTSSA
jgi:DNA polymerase delta subunit 4